MKSIMENLILIYGLANLFPHGYRAFKQVQLQEEIRIPDGRPDVEHIASISIKVEISKSYIAPTAIGVSYEGQILSGRKLVVEGKIHQKLEYVADLVEQPVHAAHFFMPFSSFIVIGKEIDCYSEFDVAGYVEDVYIKQLDKRRIYKNILLLLNAVPANKI